MHRDTDRHSFETNQDACTDRGAKSNTQHTTPKQQAKVQNKFLLGGVV